MTIEISTMHKAEIPEILQIEEASFSDPWNEQNLKDAFLMDFSVMLTAHADGAVVGYCCLYQMIDEGEILKVAVAPAYRRKGIGDKLLGVLLDEASAQGVIRFVLNVRMSNEPAIALYESVGFEKIALQKNFYEKPQEDAWLLELRRSGWQWDLTAQETEEYEPKEFRI